MPKPGGIGRGDGGGPSGVYHEEIVAVGFPRAETTEAWIELMTRSGRGAALRLRLGRPGVIRAKHRSVGLPKYLHGHHPNPLRRGFDALRKKGDKLVGEIAKLLGVSENTVRRMEAEGMIPKARRLEIARGKNVRAFTAKEVERIARSKRRNQWRRKHGGRWSRGA